jgi:2-polyprenyl-3-methyl-5-hydroxy-6-metoxy-1,4-benzoquinol methylase
MTSAANPRAVDVVSARSIGRMRTKFTLCPYRRVRHERDTAPSPVHARSTQGSAYTTARAQARVPIKLARSPSMQRLTVGPKGLTFLDVDPLATILVQEAERFPQQLRPYQIADVPRSAFHVRLVLERCGPGSRVADIGGATGLFSIGCALHGMRCALVDDFRDEDLSESEYRSALQRHEALGIEVIVRDVMGGLGLEPQSFDAVACFETLEHLHGRVSTVVGCMVEALRPGGFLILSGPNAVNLRKRVMVPLGRSNWSSFDSWFIPGPFRSHVREPTVSDFQAIAERLSLHDAQILGRNWLGYERLGQTRRGWYVATVLDRVLRRWPQLSSNIYLIARKPQ